LPGFRINDGDHAWRIIWHAVVTLEVFGRRRPKGRNTSGSANKTVTKAATGRVLVERLAMTFEAITR
jgi:hypothetical protein